MTIGDRQEGTGGGDNRGQAGGLCPRLGAQRAEAAGADGAPGPGSFPAAAGAGSAPTHPGPALPGEAGAAQRAGRAPCPARPLRGQPRTGTARPAWMGGHGGVHSGCSHCSRCSQFSQFSRFSRLSRCSQFFQFYRFSRLSRFSQLRGRCHFGVPRVPAELWPLCHPCPSLASLRMEYLDFSGIKRKSRISLQGWALPKPPLLLLG